MKVTIAIDSFKGSLSSEESAKAAEDGIRKVYPGASIVKLTVADGGEGTVRAIASARGELCSMTVSGPLMKPTVAEYAILDGGVAVLEMASAAGLTLLDEGERNPMLTTTYGVGEMIRRLILDGVRNFILGIGGSATNDGGVGMLSALGYKFLDSEGAQITPNAKGLSRLNRIDSSEAMAELAECSFRVACDVDNPLCGERGASAVFAPQKGASPDDVKLMDGYLSRYAELTAELFGEDFSSSSGAGAAGGLGFALIAYLGARTEPGVGLVAELIGLEEHIKDSDVVITGEGRFDGQSLMGKAPVGIARVAKKYSKPTVALCGAVGDGIGKAREEGISAVFAIPRSPATLAECMDKERAYANVAFTAEEIFSLLYAAGMR